MLKKSTLDFLKKLKKNNNREWFAANKHLYEDAKTDYEIFVYELIQEIAEFDPSVAGLRPEDSMFRIYRDVRFSKDKSPYKTAFGAVIQEGGRKSGIGGYYFHLQPGNSFSAGGFFMPDPAKLLKIRRAVAENYKEFTRILKAKDFVKYFKTLSEEDKLKTVPKGFAKEHPAAELLKLKSYLVWHGMNDEEVLSKDLIKKAAKIFHAMQPLNKFLNNAI